MPTPLPHSWLFLGGILSSAISALMVLRLGSWLFGGRGGFLPVAELYGGLIIFMGYVLFDTQVVADPPLALSLQYSVRLSVILLMGYILYDL